MFFAVANTILSQLGVGTGPTPPPPLIWNTATNRWDTETQTWD